MTLHTVSSSTDLLNFLQDNPDGGYTIKLLEGDYGDVRFSNFNPASEVTIMSDDPDARAEFSKITTLDANNIIFKDIGISTASLRDSSNLTFDNIDIQFVPDASTVGYTFAFTIHSSHDIQVVNSTFKGEAVPEYFENSADAFGISADTVAIAAPSGEKPDPDKGDFVSQEWQAYFDTDWYAYLKDASIHGYPNGRAISIAGQSSGIEIDQNDISGFRSGIVVSKSTDLTISNNEFHNLRSSPINGGNVQDVFVFGNHSYDQNPWRTDNIDTGLRDGDHAAFLHFWVNDEAGAPEGSGDNIHIYHNLFTVGTDKGDESILGIEIEDNRSPVDNQGSAFTNLQITNNVLHLRSAQAIFVENGDGVVIDGNTLLQSGGGPRDAPRIILLEGNENTSGIHNVQITNNILGEYDGTAIFGDAVKTDSQTYGDDIDLSVNGSGIFASNNLLLQSSDIEAEDFVGNFFVNPLNPFATLDDLIALPGTSAELYGSSLLHLDERDLPSEKFLAILSENGEGLQRLAVDFSVSDLAEHFSQAELEAMTVEWDFGDGTASESGISKVHEYTQAGTYEVKGTVTGTNGAMIAEVKKTVVVETAYALNIDFESGKIVDQTDEMNELVILAPDAGQVNFVTVGGKTGLQLSEASAIKVLKGPELKNNEAYTVSFDFLYEDVSQDGFALYLGDTVKVRFLHGQIELYGQTSDVHSFTISTKGDGFDDNAWHNLSYVFSDDADSVSLFIDGVEIKEADADKLLPHTATYSLIGERDGQTEKPITLDGLLTGIQDLENGENFFIGSLNGSNTFTGLVDDISFTRAAVYPGEAVRGEGDLQVLLVSSPVSLEDLPSKSNGTVIGTDAAEFLIGTVGSDHLEGNGGNDFIDAGAGNDWNIYGGEGEDTFMFGSGFEIDQILDFEFGVDSLWFTDGLTAADLKINNNDQGHIKIFVTGTTDQVILRNAAGEFTLTYDDLLFDTLTASPNLSEGSDPTEGFEKLFSNLNGTAIGTDAAEFLIGSDGSNYLQGKGGDDAFNAGAGNDWNIYGGAGEDAFVFETGFEIDQILDFEYGVDGLWFTDGLTAADLEINNNDQGHIKIVVKETGDVVILREDAGKFALTDDDLNFF